MSAHEAPFCGAVSGTGTPVTAYVDGMAVFVIATKRRNFICTQDRGHGGDRHSACDGRGHILAKWPRSTVERIHQPGDCAGHEH